ncbi:choice-of-anchor P family protein [Nocardioides mangrovi]|uniref:Choice-of-anchor G family protein n=1 Tax=Nocardioides mangrovi TaxID=2874580 RepID=A0ABS7UCL0_9ACTN|nr:choice-of-anchor P family protein [Nocardioides mangrovi]MBZ5738575.1 hypothetical protein [Nocardioides mangrovi]
MKRYLVPLAVAALAGAALPVSAGPSAQAADAKAGFSGYSSTATATPLMIEVYEPTIPIPATPQLEVEVGYTTVEADSGSSAGRASWLWPGDPVGEGFKTFVEQLGLPEQLGENGYPVQVNSTQPGGEDQQTDEPFPGTVMRTSASTGRTVAQAGFSPDGQVQDGTGGDDQDQAGDEGTPGVPGLPQLPGLPGLPGASDALADFGAAITGSSGAGAGGSDGDGSGDDAGSTTPGLPPELAAVVDVEGLTSSSQSVAKAGSVVTTARSALGDVSLLGGVITLDGLVVTSSSSTDGATGKPAGKATIGGLTIAGQEFSFGPDGLEAAGQQQAIPGLPDQASAALKQLGVRLELPKPVRTKDGAKAISTMTGLRVVLDLAQLRKKLDALPIDQLVDAVPSEAGELKSLLQAVAGLSPKIVLSLGNASTSVDTVQGIKVPTDIPDNDPSASGGTGSGGGGSAASGGSAPSSGGAPPATSGDAPAAADDLGDAQLAGSGLPPLYSIPGAILAGGIALGAVAGTWLRRIGVLTLGGAGSCSHGLDSGLPDLRKA